MSVAPSLAGSTAPGVIASPSGQPHPSLKMGEKVLKENTAATLASIVVDEAASCINVTAAQEFDVETEKDSSGEESDYLIKILRMRKFLCL